MIPLTLPDRVDSKNDAVITACDFVGMDGKQSPPPSSPPTHHRPLTRSPIGYPYFQGSSIETASTTFWNSVIATRNAVNAVSPGKWVWVTETGWPVAGAKYGAAVASVKNAQTYWRNVACQAFNQVHVFWYVESDYWEAPSFGVFDKNGKALYDLAAC